MLVDRIYKPDERDAFYNGKDLYIPTHRRTRRWKTGNYESPTGRHSVGVAWYNWMYSQRGKMPAPKFIISPHDFMHPESPDAGTIRGGAKFLQKHKLIRSYYWTTDVSIINNYLINYGPVVVGTYFTEGMTPLEQETALAYGTGDKIASYAYVIDSVNTNLGRYRIRLHFGNDWGRDGLAYVPIDDIAELLQDEGEACLPVGFGKKWKPT